MIYLLEHGTRKSVRALTSKAIRCVYLMFVAYISVGKPCEKAVPVPAVGMCLPSQFNSKLSIHSDFNTVSFRHLMTVCH